MAEANKIIILSARQSFSKFDLLLQKGHEQIVHGRVGRGEDEHLLVSSDELPNDLDQNGRLARARRAVDDGQIGTGHGELDHFPLSRDQVGVEPDEVRLVRLVDGRASCVDIVGEQFHFARQGSMLAVEEKLDDVRTMEVVVVAQAGHARHALDHSLDGMVLNGLDKMDNLVWLDGGGGGGHLAEANHHRFTINLVDRARLGLIVVPGCQANGGALLEAWLRLVRSGRLNLEMVEFILVFDRLEQVSNRTENETLLDQHLHPSFGGQLLTNVSVGLKYGIIDE